MKRLITLLLAFTMLFVIAGCTETDTVSYSGGTSESTQHTDNETENKVVEKDKEESSIFDESVETEKETTKTETKVESFVEKEPEKETNTVTVPSQPETSGNLVWIPTNGGVKYHKKSSCSNMKNPIRVTIETAKSNGFGPCGRCY